MESAWQGQDNAWQGKLAPPSPEILDCIRLCRVRGIPTVFWNKEDPVHFGTFLPLAKHFDHVFTTDIDCIPRYKLALGHDRVSLLPFAAQPRLQNPLAGSGRKAAFSFAGSWYQRYPKRQQDFAELVKAVSSIGPLDIFDRNAGDSNPATRFPAEYAPLIKGHLPFEEIDRAYKGYRFALNVNTVKHSQTMFARRVFELLASNTVVVSNEALGMRTLFGDLVVAADDAAALRDNVLPLWTDETRYRKHRLLGLRAVLREHTYAHRLEYVQARLEGRRWRPEQPAVVVIAIADSQDDEQRIVANVLRQDYPCRALVLQRYAVAASQRPDSPHPRIECLVNEGCWLAAVRETLLSAPWLALFVAEDIYGPYYLTDLVQARHYSDAAAFGKVACHVVKQHFCVLEQDGTQYLPTTKLAARAALIRTASLPEGWLERCLADPANLWLEWPDMLAIDEFHYCRDGVRVPVQDILECIGDLPLADLGLSLAEDILPMAESLTAADYRPPVVAESALQIPAATLHEWLTPRLPEGISLELLGAELLIHSRLAAQEQANLYAAPRFSRDGLNLRDNNQVRLLAEHDLPELKTVFEYQDTDRRKTGHTMNSAGAAYSLLLPEDCEFLRFALRLQGPGTARIQALVLGETIDPPAVRLCKRELHGTAAEKLAPILSRSTGISSMSLSSRATAAFRSGQHALAVDLYQLAMAEQPELAHLYLLTLNMARKKLGLEPIAERAAPATSPSWSDGALRPAARGTVTLDDLYQQVALVAQRTPAAPASQCPLVSVLMTSHNVAEYIEEAVTSVLRQSWPNLELVVVDDASSDETWPILQRLQRSVSNLRCCRLNSNLGTYFAKNHALQLAKGEFVFFQDGDDICHPERIRLGMQQLMQPGVDCVRGAYSRVLFPSGQVLPVNGMVSKLGLITLGLRRDVFARIGFFNCTSKASDEEFFQRLLAWVAAKGGEVRELDLPLYYNTLREGSLFADMIANDPLRDGNIEQRPSPSRAGYMEAFARKHRELGVERFRDFFRYPVLRDLIAVEPDMTYLANPAQPVVASLCSIPERADQLRQTLASLAPQVDALHLYLDRYESVPDFVKDCHPQVKVYLSQDYPGLRDNGKFLAFATQAEACYYFTADDDILYPPDYVASMVRRIEHYGRQAVVGVHGVLVPEEAQGYFSGFRKVLMFTRELERDALVSNLGTGTVAFHSSLLRGLDIAHFREAGMADIYLSLFCKQRNIPMVAIARPEGWLQELPSPNTSLYQEFRQADERQSLLIRTYRPWGYTAIRQALAGVRQRVDDAQVHQRLEALVPALHQCLR
ncbi:glycosyltransferase [Stutzerimonas kunmingensis]|uniref:glycosyltransferase n=1 Tax=Stutzerimonas kunmingensis TaxID=1211807 RepID=UPI00241C366D|nr:glycosyltransferase [Stutzerimonas kunmingensis]